MTPCLEATYAAFLASPITPAMLAAFTILPYGFMLPISALVQYITPVKFTSRTNDQSSSSNSSTRSIPILFGITPARFAAPSNLPACSTVRWIHALTCFGSRTSRTVVRTFPPVFSIFAAKSLRLCSYKSAIDTVAPEEASSSAKARPIPEPPPVIAITFSWKSNFVDMMKRLHFGGERYYVFPEMNTNICRYISPNTPPLIQPPSFWRNL